MSKVLILGVKDLRKLVRKRIKNRYDCNIIVTGKVGVGKSTFIYQLLKDLEDLKLKINWPTKEMNLLD